jgi:thioredoxin reductase (NADPH)
MGKPVILAVDDDPQVLYAIERDLKKRYNERFRVLRAGSGRGALDLLRRLEQRNEVVALLLVDHRMPQMTGVETLQEAMKLYPRAKRTLLTAYADTDAAIKAINDIQLNHYLLKPWAPPERNLYPVLDDLLNDWGTGYHPPFEGIRLVGTRWSSKSYEIRCFLARNHVPYQWLDANLADRDQEIDRVVKDLPSECLKLPLVLFPDGNWIAEPQTQELAEKLGLRTHADLEFYDLAIVGGGPAGLAAAVYGASEGLKTVMVEREAPGGQAGCSSRIENYLGFPSGISGGDLTRRAVAQARRFGVEIVSPQEATALRVDGPYRYLHLSGGTELSCHAMLLATGVQWRQLDVPGIDRLQGAGVYYGGTASEAPASEGEDVFIVGAANSAGQAAIAFSQYARRVVILVRGDSLGETMSQYLVEQIKFSSNIQVEYCSRVVEVHGDDHLESVSTCCDLSGVVNRVPANSLFIFIGAEPSTAWLDGVIQKDERGFIHSSPNCAPKGLQNVLSAPRIPLKTNVLQTLPAAC